MEIYLRDLNLSLVAEWTRAFKGCDNVHISHGKIFAPGEHMDADAVISPANSFGFMDGGIDQVYTNYFGTDLQVRLQHELRSLVNGELLVGEAMIVPTLGCALPHLICAPTMRVPEDVSNTINAYLAFRAALSFDEDFNEIQSILCPGLCTATGRMTPRKCANQMRQAYDDVGRVFNYNTLYDAHVEQNKMNRIQF